MGVRALVVAIVVAAASTFPMAGVAAAQDLNCENFATPAEAQAVYNRNPADPNKLDLDKDGRACEALPGGAPGSAEGSILDTEPTPTGGVETGAGGTADLGTAPGDAAADDSGPLLPLGVAGGAVLAAGGLVLLWHRGRRSD